MQKQDLRLLQNLQESDHSMLKTYYFYIIPIWILRPSQSHVQLLFITPHIHVRLHPYLD